MHLIEKYLPKNCHPGRRLKSVEGIIIHYFSASRDHPENPYDIDLCWDLFAELKLSANVLIGRKGEAYFMVPLTHESWHAGVSWLNGKFWCNKFTVGIELIGDRASGFTPAQYDTLGFVCAEIMENNNFAVDKIVGHDTVRFNALQRGHKARKKYDPSGKSDGSGHNFKWLELEGKVKEYA